MANTVDTMCARNKHEDELHENALGSKRKNRQRVDALGFRLPLEGEKFHVDKQVLKVHSLLITTAMWLVHD